MLDKGIKAGIVVAMLAASVVIRVGEVAAFKAQTYPDYPSQREPLQAKLGGDIFVAKFSAILVDSRAVTFAVWTDGVPTALPKTDFVLVQSEDYAKKFFVPWAELKSAIGELKLMAGTNPPRYLTPQRMPAGYLTSVERNYRVPNGLPDFSK